MSHEPQNGSLSSFPDICRSVLQGSIQDTDTGGQFFLGNSLSSHQICLHPSEDFLLHKRISFTECRRKDVTDNHVSDRGLLHDGVESADTGLANIGLGVGEGGQDWWQEVGDVGLGVRSHGQGEVADHLNGLACKSLVGIGVAFLTARKVSIFGFNPFGESRRPP